MRSFGAGLAAAGILTAMAWGVTAGSRPQAVLGGFDVPIAGLAAVIVGLLVWMAGMARAERAEDSEWAKLGPGYSSIPPLDTGEIRIRRISPRSAQEPSLTEIEQLA